MDYRLVFTSDDYSFTSAYVPAWNMAEFLASTWGVQRNFTALIEVVRDLNPDLTVFYNGFLTSTDVKIYISRCETSHQVIQNFTLADVGFQAVDLSTG